MTYNPLIEVHGMQATAKADLIAARLLWNLGLIAQAIWLLQQSAEKYLKCLWAQGKSFKDEKDLERRLRNLGHDIGGIFNSLSPAFQKKIKNPMWVVQLDAIRYKGTFGYDYTRFRSGEKFINDIRILLGEKIRKNYVEEWQKTALRMAIDYKQEGKALQAVKAVIALTNPRTKKEKTADKRRFDFIIANLK